MTDKFVPVYDGNLNPDEDGILVLIPTRENIEALRDRGNYLMAFTLQRSKISSEAIRYLSERGVRVPPVELSESLHDLLRDPEKVEREDYKFMNRILEIADEKVKAGKLELTAGVRAAVQLLLHFRNLSNALAQIKDADLAELWAASVLSASSVGFTTGQLWGDELANEFRPAEDFSESMHSAGGKARAAQKAWWWPEGLKRCQEKRAANPGARTSELIRALKRMFKPLLDKPREERPAGSRDLPESDNGWRSAIESWEKSGDLPRRQA